MLADAEQQQSRGLVAEIGQVRALEFRVVGQGLREIEAERQLALEPGFDGVPVRGEHLRREIRGKVGHVLIAGLGDQCGVLRGGDG